MRLPSSLPFSLALAVTTAVAGAAVLPHSPAAAATPVLDRRIHAAAVVESSGLARSTYGRDVLWTHNDSGGTPQVYAIGADGSTQAVVTLRGARALDWEDIASGPDHRLWVGDIGDNSRHRDHVTAYRIDEPQTLDNVTVAATGFDLVYPDGPHNAEALLVHPTTGRLYVVTKSPYGGAVYVAPTSLSAASPNRLTRVASAPIKVTAGTFSPDGSRMVLCNYGSAFLYRTIGGPAVVLGKPPLRQGESLEIDRSGTEILMGSEGPQSPVYRIPLPG